MKKFGVMSVPGRFAAKPVGCSTDGERNTKVVPLSILLKKRNSTLTTHQAPSDDSFGAGLVLVSIATVADAVAEAPDNPTHWRR